MLLADCLAFNKVFDLAGLLKEEVLFLAARTFVQVVER